MEWFPTSSKRASQLYPVQIKNRVMIHCHSWTIAVTKGLAKPLEVSRSRFKFALPAFMSSWVHRVSIFQKYNESISAAKFQPMSQSIDRPRFSDENERTRWSNFFVLMKQRYSIFLVITCLCHPLSFPHPRPTPPLSCLHLKIIVF